MMKKLLSVTLLQFLAFTSTVTNGELIWQDEFDTLDMTTWQHVVTGVSGNHEFQYYRNNRSNSYVKDGVLYIKTTLTADQYGNDFLYNGQINLRDEGCDDEMNVGGGCTVASSSIDIVDPIQSARLRTKNSFNMMYGRVEIRAMLPRGDWLWPAIWMMPKDEVYGGWPQSGEMDLVDAKGNEMYTCNGQLEGHQKAVSAMYWGPDGVQNGYLMTHWSSHDAPHPYGSHWHLYGLEWDEEGIKFTIDSNQVGSVSPPEGGFFELGGFEGVNVWSQGTKMAPFDREFFFILNLAVGGNHFPDGCTNANGAKPWAGLNVPGAQKSFWEARDAWYPTWKGEDAALKIDYIRVYNNALGLRGAEGMFLVSMVTLIMNLFPKILS